MAFLFYYFFSLSSRRVGRASNDVCAGTRSVIRVCTSVKRLNRDLVITQVVAQYRRANSICINICIHIYTHVRPVVKKRVHDTGCCGGETVFWERKKKKKISVCSRAPQQLYRCTRTRAIRTEIKTGDWFFLIRSDFSTDPDRRGRRKRRKKKTVVSGRGDARRERR